MAKKKYTIGIDFGTTNSTFAYTLYDAENDKIEIQQFSIPQITSPGVIEELPIFPSFIYFPLPEELDKKITHVGWQKESDICMGFFARNRGAELSTRLLSSAKSWICHSGIDRRESLLPINGDENVRKVSPLEACAQLLSYIKESWDSKMADAPFVKQQVLVTVPASFDPSARQLVQEAAQMAGYPEIILLEEPQAAFYSWLELHSESWRNQLKVGDTVLVVDIGGGTTDFSLITVSEDNGNLTLQRQAVGTHLLLGGDNIDLALAMLAKDKLEQKGSMIDDWQIQSLVYSCRQGKEALFSANPSDCIDVTIMGRGSRLIGGSLKTKITRKEAQELILEGFFPIVDATRRSVCERHTGIQQVGLPYALDPRVTAQLAKFLSMTGEADSESMENFVYPTAVLFNGGTLKSEAFRNRIVEQLDLWGKQAGKEPVKVLSEADYDYAVSRGAAYYGMARKGKAIRIKSGTSRSYYIGVQDAVPAIPGRPIPIKAVCIVPFGMEEGTELELSDRQFALILGELATFRFFSHSTAKLSDGTVPEIGTVVKNWEKELIELHPIETVLEKTQTDGKTVRVHLKSRFNELGVLEVWCVGPNDRKWKLEFDIRKEESTTVA